MNKRFLFGLGVMGVLCVIAFIAAQFLDLSEIVSGKSKPATVAKTEAMSLSNKEFKVVKSTTTRFYSDLMLENPNRELPLMPCTDEQRAIRLGDTVSFRYSPVSLNPSDPNSENWFCYLAKK
jgi:hypothetical protein